MLQWYFGDSAYGVRDDFVAVTGDRTDAAETVVAIENMVDCVGVAERLHGQQERQQQDSKRCEFSVRNAHGHENTGFERLSPYQRPRSAGLRSPRGIGMQALSHTGRPVGSAAFPWG